MLQLGLRLRGWSSGCELSIGLPQFDTHGLQHALLARIECAA
jgi:hypothetical protein